MARPGRKGRSSLGAERSRQDRGQQLALIRRIRLLLDQEMYKKTPLGSADGGYIDHEGDYIEVGGAAQAEGQEDGAGAGGAEAEPV